MGLFEEPQLAAISVKHCGHGEWSLGRKRACSVANRLPNQRLYEGICSFRPDAQLPLLSVRVLPYGEAGSRSANLDLQQVVSLPAKKTSLMKFKSSIPSALATATLLLSSVSLFAADTDDRIESAAKKSYVFKTYLKHDSVKTEAKDGVVTLTGTVADADHRAMAETTVENLPGVTRVDNRLKLKVDAPAEHSDGWLSTKVKTTLLFHRNVSASKTDVFVQNGVVSLRGEAVNLAQKELTEEYAKDVEGVKEVKNEMTLARTPTIPTEPQVDRIDDASITAQVKASLLSHRSTSALKTKVQTRDGVVTLSGSAKNEAEKSLVTKLVSDINGVISVVNNMTVGVPVAKD